MKKTKYLLFISIFTVMLFAAEKQYAAKDQNKYVLAEFCEQIMPENSQVCSTISTH